MTKTISLLGSTGSIGRQTLQVARELGLSVAALTANRQVDLLEQQAREFHPALAVLYDRDAARQLRLRLSDTDIRVEAGPEGLLLAAQLPQADTVVTAVMGSVGLEDTRWWRPKPARRPWTSSTRIRIRWWPCWT